MIFLTMIGLGSGSFACFFAMAYLPRIPSNILTTRLKELRESGLAVRIPLAHNALAYRLTERGEALRAAIEALDAWGAEPLWATE